MGKSTSNIAALMALAWMEDESRRNIPRTLRCRMGGARLMDDLFVGSVYMPGDPQSERDAEYLLSAIEYHSDLELERTDEPGDSAHRFLEGTISIGDGSRLTCDFFNPNAVSLLKDGVCCKPRFRSWSSYGPSSVKRQVVLGFFRRMRGYCQTDDLASAQTTHGPQLLLELLHCGYPLEWLRWLIRSAADSVVLPAARSALLADILYDHRIGPS